MCGRYRRTTAEEEIGRQFHVPIPPQLDLPISYNIAPSQNFLAVRRNPESGQRTLDAPRCGFIPSWASIYRLMDLRKKFYAMRCLFRSMIPSNATPPTPIIDHV